MKQPYSKLPWVIDYYMQGKIRGIIEKDDPEAKFYGGGIVKAVGGDSETARQREIQDFEYIVEACNNYPKTIELLKRCYEVLPVGVKSYIDKLEKEVGEFLNEKK